MEKIRLGQTGMMVSRLGLGGIPIQRPSEDEAVSVVRRCLDLGVNFIDTAAAYTNSEERIGKAITGQRDGLILATKSHARDSEGVEKHLKLSLKRLGTDYIDLYQIHGVNDFKTYETVLDLDGPMGVVWTAKKAGYINHIGFTSHSMDIAKEAVKSGHFETIMFAFNFIADEAASELLPLAREYDVGFIAMKPLAGGALENITIAFKYLFQFPDVVPIPGIQKTQEIEELVELLAVSPVMTETDRDEMQRIRQELGTRFCRHCEYCQPCPQEVPISLIFYLRSLTKHMALDTIFASAMISEGIAKAVNCAQCGECEEKCPYGLPIRDMLAEETDWYLAEKSKYQERMASK